MKSITLHIRVEGDQLTGTWRGRQDYRSAAFIRFAGQHVPDIDYRVRYSLDPAGRLSLGLCGFVENKAGIGFVVCFLERLKGWKRGARVRREVLPAKVKP